MKITGLDLSLTSTGVASIYWGMAMGQVSTARIIPPAKLGTGHERLQFLLEQIAAAAHGANYVVLEGPSYGSPNAQHKMGGLWWLVAHGLYRRGQPYAIVTPQQRAKYITGKGNAGKDEVLLAAARRYPQVQLAGNDDADALVLAAMCADHLHNPLAVMPEAQRAVLAKVSWPWDQEVPSAQGQAAAG